MKLWSDSWTNGERIPSRFAAGRLDAPDGVTFADNLSPHLAWSELPPGTRSLDLICHDFDVPSRGDDVFTLYVVDVANAPVESAFGGAELRQAIHPHILAEATHSGTYTLNRRLLA